MEKTVKLSKLERGEVFNMLYEHKRCTTGRRQEYIRHRLIEYIERLLNREVK